MPPPSHYYNIGAKAVQALSFSHQQEQKNQINKITSLLSVMRRKPNYIDIYDFPLKTIKTNKTATNQKKLVADKTYLQTLL